MRVIRVIVYLHHMQKTKVSIMGAGFIADIHLESYHRFVPDAEVTAVYARTLRKQRHLLRNTIFLNGMMILTRSLTIRAVM